VPVLILLTDDLLLPERIMVAGSVEVDDVTVPRILKDGMLPIKGLSLDRRELQMAIVAGGVGNFGNDTLSSP